MKTVQISVTILTLVIGLFTSVSADRLLSMKFGGSWPRALLSTGIPSGNAEVNYGIIVDRKVAFGISGDFLWNVQSQETGEGSNYRLVSEEKSFMFPIMGFIQLDPMPELIVHPLAYFQIGYNSMIYSYTRTDSLTYKQEPLSPYFYGLIMKTGADAIYAIGEQSSLFLGFEYRWATMQTAKNADALFSKKNMGGIGISAGFRVTL